MEVTQHEALALDSLTPTERDVFKLLARGNTAKDIANELGLEVKTAEVHRTNVRTKLGCPTHSHITALALKPEGVAYEELEIHPPISERRWWVAQRLITAMHEVIIESSRLRRFGEMVGRMSEPKTEYPCSTCGGNPFIGYGAGWGGLVKKGERLCTRCFRARGGAPFY